jgi:hypothetical protein
MTMSHASGSAARIPQAVAHLRVGQIGDYYNRSKVLAASAVYRRGAIRGYEGRKSCVLQLH